VPVAGVVVPVEPTLTDAPRLPRETSTMLPVAGVPMVTWMPPPVAGVVVVALPVDVVVPVDPVVVLPAFEVVVPVGVVVVVLPVEVPVPAGVVVVVAVVAAGLVVVAVAVVVVVAEGVVTAGVDVLHDKAEKFSRPVPQDAVVLLAGLVEVESVSPSALAGDEKAAAEMATAAATLRRTVRVRMCKSLNARPPAAPTPPSTPRVLSNH
jgi:hypothetical protein